MQGTTFENSFLEVTRSNGLSLGVYSKGSELRTITEKHFFKIESYFTPFIQICFLIRFETFFCHIRERTCI